MSSDKKDNASLKLSLGDPKEPSKTTIPQPISAEILKKEKTVPEYIAEVYDLIAASIKQREGVDEQYLFELNGIKAALDGFSKMMNEMGFAIVAAEKAIAELKGAKLAATVSSPPQNPPTRPSEIQRPPFRSSLQRGGSSFSYNDRQQQNVREPPKISQDGWMVSKWPTRSGEQVKGQSYATDEEMSMADEDIVANGLHYYWLTRKDGSRKEYIARAPVGQG
jgi:hypothetical protein